MNARELLRIKKTIEDDAWYTANLRSNEVNNHMIALGMFRAANIITNFMLNEITEKPVDNTCEPDIEGDDCPWLR